MSTHAGARRVHGMGRSEAITPTPAVFSSASFLKLRNEWYGKLEREGMEVDEIGYTPIRQRRIKGPARGDAEHYEAPTMEHGVALDVAERVNVRHFGAPRSVWGLDVSEYWRLMSSEAVKLPDSYKGKTFLVRWSEIGDVKTAAAETGTTRWKGRDFVDRFKALLRQKKVLR